MKTAYWIASLAVGVIAAAFLTQTLLAQEAVSRPSLAGAWTLNKDLSDDASKMRDQAGRTGERGGGMGRTGGFGGGPGGMGGGIGRSGSMRGGSRPDPEKMKQSQDVVRELTDPSPRLTIIQTERDITFIDADGHSQKLATTGEKEKHQLGSGTVETHTTWDGPRLVKQTSVPEGMTKITETYSLNAEKRQLEVAVKLEGARGRAFTLRRVYDSQSN